jgi:transcriptional regulator of acetoin/glycerol metabolism
MRRKRKTSPGLRKLRRELNVKPLAETVQLEIVHAMKVAKGDTLLAATLLGIGKTTIYRRLKTVRRRLW